MAGIGVVLNPFSKRYKKAPDKLDHMAFIIGDKASCKPTEDIDDLIRVAEEFKSRDVDVLAISGGDGTIHWTLTTFLRIYGEKPLPKITFLKGGTLNTIAATLGIKGSTDKLMSDLLIRYHEDKSFDIKKLRLTRINDQYGCIFGLGIIYNFMEAYYRNTRLNRMVAAKTVGSLVFSALLNGSRAQKLGRRFDADVIVDGQKWPFANYAAIATGSIRQLGLEFNVFHSMIKSNNGFHALALSLRPRQILPHLKKLRDGKATRSPGILEQHATRMEIHLAEPLPYTIDGNMLDPVTDFVITEGPEVTVLV